MLLGILSDTHGRFDRARGAVETLAARGAQYLVHCGDVGGDDILDLLAGVGSGAAFVFGNNDYDHEDMARHARSIGIECLGKFGSVELAGKRVAVTHGDHLGLVQQGLRDGEHDYLLVGHTHMRRDERIGGVRVINPGALHRAAEWTVALLELRTDTLEFVEV